MTYVEKMAEEFHEIGRWDWPEDAEPIIEQIIADTKRACKIAITQQFEVYLMQIDQAQVKEKQSG